MTTNASPSPRREAPNSEQVQAFWRHMTSLYRTRTIAKANRIEMQVAARFLAKLGILDAAAFLNRYTTTVGRRIYTPFCIGVPQESHDLWSQMVICVHEHQHVEQLDRERWAGFGGRYLLSSSARALYEAEAYRCNIELHFWRYRRLLDPAKLAQRLHHYGCNDADIALAQRSLELCLETISNGGITNRASELALTWLTTYAPELQRT